MIGPALRQADVQMDSEELAQDATDTEMATDHEPVADTVDKGEIQEEPAIVPGVAPAQKKRAAPRESFPKAATAPASSDTPTFGNDDVASPLGSSRESKSNKFTNMQNLKNQLPQFLEYAAPRVFNDAHFISAEGGIDWVKGVPPREGGAKSIFESSNSWPPC